MWRRKRKKGFFALTSRSNSGMATSLRFCALVSGFSSGCPRLCSRYSCQSHVRRGCRLKADTDRFVALLAQNFGQRWHFGAQRAFVAQRHHLGAKDIAPGQHRGIGRGGGDVGAKGVLEECAPGWQSGRCAAWSAVDSHSSSCGRRAASRCRRGRYWAGDCRVVGWAWVWVPSSI